MAAKKGTSGGQAPVKGTNPDRRNRKRWARNSPENPNNNLLKREIKVKGYLGYSFKRIAEIAKAQGVGEDIIMLRLKAKREQRATYRHMTRADERRANQVKLESRHRAQKIGAKPAKVVVSTEAAGTVAL